MPKLAKVALPLRVITSSLCQQHHAPLLATWEQLSLTLLPPRPIKVYKSIAREMVDTAIRMLYIRGNYDNMAARYRAIIIRASTTCIQRGVTSCMQSTDGLSGVDTADDTSTRSTRSSRVQQQRPRTRPEDDTRRTSRSIIKARRTATLSHSSSRPQCLCSVQGDPHLLQWYRLEVVQVDRARGQLRLAVWRY